MLKCPRYLKSCLPTVSCYVVASYISKYPSKLITKDYSTVLIMIMIIMIKVPGKGRACIPEGLIKA